MSKYLSFVDAREFARSLGLTSQMAWKEYCKSGKKPNNISSTPEKRYKTEWLGIGDWLDTNRISTKKMEFISFMEAREFTRNLGLSNRMEWMKYCKLGKKPNNIPTKPEKTYRKLGWIDYDDWLNSGYLPFEDAREFIRSINLKGQKEWEAYCTSGRKPNNIPRNPYKVYNDKWGGWANWVRDTRNGYLPIEEAYQLLQTLKFPSEAAYMRYVRNNPNCGLPLDLEKVYGNKLE
jgi:hypothetical protein